MTSVSDDSVSAIFGFFTEIGILHQLSTAELTRALGSRMNSSEFGVLTHFSRLNHAVTPTYLARAFQMAKPSMTAVLAKLEAKGYVAIKPASSDRRRKFVRMTPAGASAHAEALSRIAPLMAQRLSGFDVEKISKILPILSELRAHMDAARNEADGIV
jgi:DNA-binding MarR family transcriptional regulator